MSVPQLRFKDNDGQDFLDWNEQLLGNVCKINQGLQIPISERFSIGGESRYFYITNEFLRKDSEKQYFIENPPASVLCNEEDVLMTRTGNTGKVVTGVSGAFHNNFFKIKYDRNVLNKTFLCEFLSREKTQSLILKLAGTSTIPDLNHSDFYGISIQFPSLPEQTKIANFLMVIDEKISQLTQKCDLLAQYKKGLMQQIFSKELRFKDDDGRDFPEWEGATLDDVAVSISNGLSLDQNLENSGFKVTRIETISEKKINLEKVGYIKTEQNISSSKLEIGNILFSNINSISHIGKVVYIDEDYDLYHGMNLLRIVIGQTKNNPKFVFYQLSTEKMKQGFEVRANKAVNQASINQKELKKTELLIPTKLEQTKIANFLTAIDDKITATQTQLAAVKQYKQGLLQKMFV